MRILKSEYFPKVLLEKKENGLEIFRTTPFWVIKILRIQEKMGRKEKPQELFFPILFHEEEGE